MPKKISSKFVDGALAHAIRKNENIKMDNFNIWIKKDDISSDISLDQFHAHDEKTSLESTNSRENQCGKFYS